MTKAWVDTAKIRSTIFIGKSTLKILYSLKEKSYRHSQLRRSLGGISQQILTRALRNLESAGLIDRT